VQKRKKNRPFLSQLCSTIELLFSTAHRKVPFFFPYCSKEAKVEREGGDGEEGGGGVRCCGLAWAPLCCAGFCCRGHKGQGEGAKTLPLLWRIVKVAAFSIHGFSFDAWS